MKGLGIGIQISRLFHNLLFLLCSAYLKQSKTKQKWKGKNRNDDNNNKITPQRISLHLPTFA